MKAIIPHPMKDQLKAYLTPGNTELSFDIYFGW